MRNEGAMSRGKRRGHRGMSALQVWLWLLLFIFQNEFGISKTAEPGYLDFDNLPDTNFTCGGKVIGGYYADLETDCQMFHVCTLGQLEEPMDIKFLCLNGTVFDQETRVCERVDEVDCSKSEHFYSLNLELYGNTAPPIIKAEPSPANNEDEGDEEGEDEEYEEIYDETSTTAKPTTSTTTTTTTKRPQTTTTRTYHTTFKSQYYHTTVQPYQSQREQTAEEDEDEAYDLIEENEQHNSPNKTKTNLPHHHFPHFNPDLQLQRPIPGQKNKYSSYTQHSSTSSSKSEENPENFAPQDFTYHHNKPIEASGNVKPAISFQQQSFSSDGQNSHVTVTTHTGRNGYNQDGSKNQNNHDNAPSRTYLSSSTPQSDTNPNFNGYQSFSAPKRMPLIPTPNDGQPPSGHPGLPAPKHQNEPLYFSFRKPLLSSPQGFKPSQGNPSNVNQSPSPITKTSAKPFQSYQPSERHEIAVDSVYDFEKLTPPYPFIHQDFSQYHFEHKRSQEVDKYDLKPSTEKPAETTTITSTPYYNTWATRNNNYTKSLPRVIVTASASVSDSNGKKLNYSVGSIVHSVKPLVPTNYDNYKESDVLLDPFFLDVPKLPSKRTRRNHLMSIRNKKFSARYKRDTESHSTNRNTNGSSETTKRTPFKPSGKRRKAKSFTLGRNSSSTLITKINKPKLTVTQSATSVPQPTTTVIQSTTVTQPTTTVKVSTTTTEKVENTTPWIPPDYVDDNYEPLTYSEPEKEEGKIDGKHKTSQTSDETQKATQSILETTLQGFTTTLQTVTTKSRIKPKKNSIATTESSVAKTTLDIATPEITTTSFLESLNEKNTSTKNYNLTSVHVVSSNEKNPSDLKFSCKGKKYYKFYPDKTDCRTFHFCSPGFSARQVLDMVFKCDQGTFFNYDTMSCAANIPATCEQ